MQKNALIQRVEELAAPICEENCVELYYVEYVREGGDNFLRIYIDKEGGVFLTDCEAVSRRVSDLLDEEDFISESYYLEVSSPGLNRGLFKEKHYLDSIGKDVLVKTSAAIEGKKKFEGKLLKVDNDNIVIKEVEDIIIPRDKIKTINLNGEI